MNPNYGHTWEVVEQDLKKNKLYGVIQHVDSVYTQYKYPPGYVGDMVGFVTMNFDALKKGKGVLNLYLSKIWEMEEKIDAS